MLSRFTGFGSTEALQIEHLKLNTRTVADLATFVNNVQIKYESPSKEIILQIINKFPVQWVIPLRTLCLRYINESKILILLHVLFLDHAIKNNCLIQALPIAEAEAFPFKLDLDYQNEFIYLCFQLYFRLGYYEKAYKKLQVLMRKRLQISSKAERYIIPYVLMSRLYQGVDLRMDQIVGIFNQEVKMGLGDTFDMPRQNKDMMALIQVLMWYAKNEKTTKNAKVYEQFLQKLVQQQKSGLWLQIYELTKNEKGRLRQYIQSLKSQQLQRVRTSQILEQPLSSPQTMNELNRLRPLCKYNSKQRILYINYEKATTDQINQLISKCYALNQSIKDASIIREKLVRGFGGFGRLDGQIGFKIMGGMGGMGFGGLGSRRHY